MRVFLVLFALIWLLGVAAFVWWRDPQAVVAMAPNEWGEFLSGVFGPLGFIAVVATLIQQGSDLKRQREQIENQLEKMEAQIAAQVTAADATKKLAQASLDQVREAAKQADATTRQTELAIERLHIERIRNRVNGLAMMAVRYADRLKTADSQDGIALIGSKEDLRMDLQLGAEAVLETVRLRVRTNTQRLKTGAFVLTSDAKRRLDDLLNNFLQRVEAMQATLADAPKLPEIDQWKTDLGLGMTRERLREIRDALGLSAAA